MKKVLIAGTFDIIHPGHINLIKQARELGDVLICVIARDENVVKTKGRAPYFNEEERLSRLSQLSVKSALGFARAGEVGLPRFAERGRGSRKSGKLIDKVILGDLNDPYKIIKEEKPRRIALGYDQYTYVNGLHDLICNSDLSSSIEILKPFKEDVCKGKNVRNAVCDSQAGFLLIDKPINWTSHDVVAKLRSITGIQSIGHTGTLDPFATGLLICAIGKATKLVGLFDLLAKTYEATIRLGVTSDTYDRTGKVSSFKNQVFKEDQSFKIKVQSVLESFIGKQKQLPPMYSAKKIGGQKLYELARKGKEVQRQPNKIEIYKIENLKLVPSKAEGFKTENSIFTIKVTCSTGTYIRTLAHDIGQKLGTGAILEELKRTAIGDFEASEAVQLNQLSKDNYSKYLIKPLQAINRVNEFYVRSVWQ